MGFLLFSKCAYSLSDVVFPHYPQCFCYILQHTPLNIYVLVMVKDYFTVRWLVPQPAYMPDVYFAFEISHAELTIISFKFLQPLNISSIYMTFVVLKLLKSRLLKPLQPYLHPGCPDHCNQKTYIQWMSHCLY